MLIVNNTPDPQSLRPPGVKQACSQCPGVYMKVFGAFQSCQPLAKVSFLAILSRVQVFSVQNFPRSL